MSLVHTVRFAGCSPVPLANYLKALGILRIISKQKDANVKGYWDGETFCLASSFTENEILEFFLECYEPTPIVAPWNGGSGFYGDKQDIVRSFETANASRFRKYREAICTVRLILGEYKLSEKTEDKRLKYQLLVHLRNELDDEALEWLDAVVMLTRDEPKFPPLLGTGGNDGNLEFTNNFMQNILRLFDVQSGNQTEDSRQYLTNSLFSIPSPKMILSAIGQFSPGKIGGPNSTNGFSGASMINPWDFVLMIEGAIVFASSATRKSESTRRALLSYPFTVKPISAGSGSISEEDEDSSKARAEMWLPLWHEATGYLELSYLFREGRVQLKNKTGSNRRAYRYPENGVDFARACASLGVDRGIESFVRYSFLKRSGKSFLAIPLSRFQVRRRESADILNELDGWLSPLADYCEAKETPESFKRAFHGIHQAMFDVAEFGGSHHIRKLLVKLSAVEKLCVHSRNARNFIRPLTLRNLEWLQQGGDLSAEWLIALAIVSLVDVNGNIPLRAYFSPIDPDQTKNLEWSTVDQPPRVVFVPGDVSKSLSMVLEKRMIDWRKDKKSAARNIGFDDGNKELNRSDTKDKRLLDDRKKPVESSFGVDLDLVLAYLYGTPDFRRRVADYVWAMLPFTFDGTIHRYAAFMRGEIQKIKIERQILKPLPWVYGITKLIFSPEMYLSQSESRWNELVKQNDLAIPIPNALLSTLKTGRIAEAVRIAEHRLKASGLIPRFQSPESFGVTGIDCVAALLIPLNRKSTIQLRNEILVSNNEQKGNEHENSI